MSALKKGVPSHQKVKVSVVPPFLLDEVPVNGFGHVRWM